MKILIINQFDKIPGENFRDQRYTFLYRKLKQKVDVTWISSDFHHWSHSKRRIEEIPDADKSNIILIKTLPYYNNISLKRFVSHSIFSIKTFIYLMKSREKYDVMIIIAPVENLFLSTLYAKRTKTRLVIDILDLWPDLFEQAFPKKIQFIAKIILKPFHLMANYAYKNADHITSVSKTYTNIAMQRGGRKDFANSSYFYLGAPDLNLDYNIAKDKKILKCLFAGQFGHNYDIELILDVAKKFQGESTNIEFYLAGAGAKQKYIEDFIDINKLQNVHLLGWLSSDELANIAKQCHIGLNSYKKSATQSIPTKIFDYMGMGLVIVNSLEGEVKEMIISDKSGDSYIAEDNVSLYNLLTHLQKDIDSLIIKGENNQKIFEQKYSFNVIYDKMVNMIMDKPPNSMDR